MRVCSKDTASAPTNKPSNTRTTTVYTGASSAHKSGCHTPLLSLHISLYTHTHTHTSGDAHKLGALVTQLDE